MKRTKFPAARRVLQYHYPSRDALRAASREDIFLAGFSEGRRSQQAKLVRQRAYLLGLRRGYRFGKDAA